MSWQPCLQFIAVQQQKWAVVNKSTQVFKHVSLPTVIRHFVQWDICSLEILRAYRALAALRLLQPRALEC